MDNISSIKHCFGCGVCAVICPKEIIDLSLNESGFYEPVISNLEACIHCGLCLKVCSFHNVGLALTNTEIKSYAAWSNDDNIRHKCSSGGVGFEIGNALINRGYKVCGVRYNKEKVRAEHYIASSYDELLQSVGSKYIQSYTLDGFKAINKREKYLVTGTPCQIDSFRRYIQLLHKEDNFILMDFFCHGVPSMLVWHKYIDNINKTIGPVKDVSWRSKTFGWHDSYAISAVGQLKSTKVPLRNDLFQPLAGGDCLYNSRLSQGDLFYAFFLGNMCLNKACYKDCKYKYRNSSADIRIGDLWGTTYSKNEDGVSAAIAFTSKGDALLQQINGTLISHSFETVAEGQIRSRIKLPKLRNFVLSRLKTKDKLSTILLVYKLCELPHRIINKIKRILDS